MINQQAAGGEVFGRFLTVEEQRKLHQTVKNNGSPRARRDGAVIRLMIGAGTRVSETLAITVGDAMAALRTGYLFIPKERRKGRVDEKRDHSVFLVRSVREALQALLELRVGAEEADALIVSRCSHGRPMSVRAFEMRVSHWAKLAGLPAGVSPHWFRHTHAKNIIRDSEASDPLRVAQISLGHASRKTTEIYGRVDREEYEAALAGADVKVNGKRRLRLADLRREFEGRAAA